jgi:exodeoxyribonuclease V gamma subunit
MVQALQSLLQLPQLRWSLNDWLGLFQVQAVREGFGLSASDVSQLHHWLNEAGVRWGLDAQHRQAWGMSSHLPDASQNTWAFGLQRLLLGYAQGGQSEGSPIWHNTLGQAGIDGLDAPVIAGLLRCLQAMHQSLEDLSQMHTPTEWVQQLQTLGLQECQGLVLGLIALAFAAALICCHRWLVCMLKGCH